MHKPGDKLEDKLSKKLGQLVYISLLSPTYVLGAFESICLYISKRTVNTQFYCWFTQAKTVLSKLLEPVLYTLSTGPNTTNKLIKE
jgi:hypothetical protein